MSLVLMELQMPRRTEFDGEGNSDANQGASLSAGRRLGTVVQFPFPRRDTAASVPAGGVETSSTPPSFQSLGSVTQAVVMRLQGRRFPLQVFVPSGSLGVGGEPDGTDDGSMGE